MIKKQLELELTAYPNFYDIVVPKDNFFRQLNELVDFNFIYEHLRVNYSEDFGRPANDLIMMFKYLIVKEIYDISDVKVVERSGYDMAVKMFLGLSPEETKLINPSSLTKFRRSKIKSDELLSLLIEKTIDVAIEHKLIKSNTIYVDATHSHAKENKVKAAKVISDRTKKIRKKLYEQDEQVKSKLPEKPKNENDIDEQIEYTKELINIIEQNELKTELINDNIEYLQEFIEDIETSQIIQDETSPAVGYKTEDQSFYGYKSHVAINDERLIVAATITPGNCSDTKNLINLIEQAQNNVEVKNVVGDGAYSSIEHIKYAQDHNLNLVSAVHPIITNSRTGTDKDGFIFNKDSNGFICPAGECSTKVNIKEGAKEGYGKVYSYFFNIEKCKICEMKEGCYKEGAATKSKSITLTSDLYEEYIERQALEENIELRKERYKIEAKFGEIKNCNTYDKARYSGTFGMQIQSAAVIFATNMKRIIKLMGE